MPRTFRQISVALLPTRLPQIWSRQPRGLLSASRRIG